MQTIREILRWFLILFFTCQPVLATDYYINCEGSGNDSGTWGNPYLSLNSLQSRLNSHVPGDDYWFVSGTRCDLTSNRQYLNLANVTGSSSNRTYFGCAQAEGDHDCTGYEWAYIDGNHTYPPSSSSYGVFHKTNNANPDDGWINIRHLRIDDAGSAEKMGDGIRFYYTQHCEIKNNFIYRARNTGIIIAYGSNNLIEGNTTWECNYNSYPNASILLIDWYNDLTQNNTVRKNFVYKSYEGIGVYTGARNNLVEKNIIVDGRSYMLYIGDGSSDNTARYNLLYITSGVEGNNNNCIVVMCESQLAGNRCDQMVQPFGCAQNNLVYGNLLAGKFNFALFLRNGCNVYDASQGTSYNRPLVNNLFINNTVIDAEQNIRVSDTESDTDSGNGFYNNLSALFSAAAIHVYGENAIGVNWNKNAYWGIDTVSGNAATGAVTGDPKLYKTSGWRSIPLYTPSATATEATSPVSGEWFSILAGSSSIDVGEVIGSVYHQLITSSTWTSPSQISVITTDDSTNPDIGAYAYGSTPPLTPEDFTSDANAQAIYFMISNGGDETDQSGNNATLIQ